MNDVKFAVDNIPYDKSHCMEGWLYAKGENPAVYVVDMSALDVPFQKPEYQLFYADMRVYETIVGTFLINDPKQTAGLYYQDFIGVLKDEYLPDWARNEIALIESKSYEKNCTPKQEKNYLVDLDDDDDGDLDF